VRGVNPVTVLKEPIAMPTTASPRTARRLTAAACCAVVTLSGAVATGAHAASPPRPDLTVSTGSVHYSAGKLSGSFVVRNTGRARARSSSASLKIRVSGRVRVLKRISVPAIGRLASRTVTVSGRPLVTVPAGSRALQACADGGSIVRERLESNNCRTVGTLRGKATPPGPTPTPTPGPTPGPGPQSSVPTSPIAFTKDTPFTLNSGQGPYWVDVPAAYDATHKTPITLFVWAHGCGGSAEGDITTISPGGDQSYIAISLGGREGPPPNDCWQPGVDDAKVMAAIADIKSHFNINPRRIVLGGYSSGGDLTYHTAILNSSMFAGVLVENSSPFKDSGVTAAQAAAAAFKFHVVHLAHTEDDTYAIATVRSETDELKAAGFPTERIERAGGHYDADAGETGTDHDLRAFLLPHLNDGWESPAS
jgi:hypothetical protein